MGWADTSWGVSADIRLHIELANDLIQPNQFVSLER